MFTTSFQKIVVKSFGVARAVEFYMAMNTFHPAR
jgi:hypothetical protein